MISKNFKEILDNFKEISETEEFKGNQFAAKFHHEFADEFRKFIEDTVCESELYYVKGFAGMVSWAKYPTSFPEFRILNYNSASDFQNGLYLLYRVDIERNCVDLILAQGRTSIDEFTLIGIADELIDMIDLPIPEGFETGFNKYSEESIMSKCYYYDELNEDILKNDLKAVLNIYENIIPKYLKLICENNLTSLMEIIHKKGKNNLQFRNDCTLNGETEEIKIYDEPKLSRNIIYFGAPGTGKSYQLNECKNNLLNDYNGSNYERVTFHPDYTYANFVGTYKPVPKNDSISYEYVPGPFMRTLVKALKNPSEPFVLIIEEINRANVAAVFGDVFQLLDRENNISHYPINASEDIKNYLENELNNSELSNKEKCIWNKYLKSFLGENYDKIRIPANMFIWATMNSADQGVFPMDTAFKRRWEFKYLSINEGNEIINNLKFNLNDREYSWNYIRELINEKLLSFNINEDKLMGPFFAFTEYIGEEKIPEDEFKRIFKNKIIMYLFEDAARSRRDALFTKNATYSEICQEFDEKGFEIFKS